MSEYIVEMYDECEKYFSEYGCKPTNTQGFPLREEIVRCRDCKWFTPEYFYEILSDPPDCGNPERCSHHYDSLTEKTVPVHIVTDPDGFCAWAERKEGGDD